MSYLGSYTGGKKYSAGGQTIYVDDETAQAVTVDSVLEAVDQDSSILEDHRSKSNPYGPVNGHYFYFSHEGGGLFSKGKIYLRSTH